MVDVNDIKEAVRTFKRIGRWGSCVNCPRVYGIIYPENCQYTKRNDHKLTKESLQRQLDGYTKIWGMKRIII